jgi:hypothetical protein
MITNGNYDAKTRSSQSAWILMIKISTYSNQDSARIYNIICSKKQQRVSIVFEVKTIFLLCMSLNINFAVS